GGASRIGVGGRGHPGGDRRRRAVPLVVRRIPPAQGHQGRGQALPRPPRGVTPASDRSKRAMRRAGDESGDALLMSLTGSSPNDMEEGVVSKGSGLSRGDKRRNAKLAELRRLVPADHVIVGIDLADKKQAVVVCDHDSQVLARKTVKA